MDFRGAKLALFLGDDLAVILRDVHREIPWPGHWDFPGGGREGAETPLACALREAEEELGLQIDPAQVVWGKDFTRKGHVFWFFVAKLPEAAAQDIVFGDEGQRWALMSPEAYASDPLNIPQFAERLALFQSGAEGAVF